MLFSTPWQGGPILDLGASISVPVRKAQNQSSHIFERPLKQYSTNVTIIRFRRNRGVLLESVHNTTTDSQSFYGLQIQDMAKAEEKRNKKELVDSSWILDTCVPGDLLFFGRIPEVAGDFEAAVLSSTTTGRDLFHVGIVVLLPHEKRRHDGQLGIVHASTKGVKCDSFMETMEDVEPDEIQVSSHGIKNEENYKIFAVDASASNKLGASQFALTKVGCPYNDVFSSNCKDSKGSEAYYCSQLVTEAYKGVELGFPPHKMKFGANEGEVLPYWVEYFRERGCPVPVGEEGSHPTRIVDAPGLTMKMSIRVAGRFASYRDTSRLSRLHWISGAPVALAGGKEFDVCEPASGRSIARCASATPEQVESAVKVAKAAQPAWAEKTWLARGVVLRRTAQLIRDHVDDIAAAECADNGKPIYEARMDVASCAETFDFYAGVGSSLAGAHYPLDSSRFAYTRREPVGVVGCVGAWNYPLQTCSWKTAPALACGNAVVYKPSPLAPVTAALLGEILKEAGLPDGVYNVLQGEGETGTALVESRGVNKVSFTGSIPTGKRIMQSCAARSIKPLTLELGGKSSLIIFGDADVDSAVAGAMMANFFSQGQVCSNASKVLVHRSIVDAFTAKLVEKTRAMKVGDPFDESTRVGAAITKEHAERVKAYIDCSVAAGARLLCGGEWVTVPGFEGGSYLSPAVLTDIKEDMEAYKEEIFGSALLLIPFDDEAEALRMANDSDMGLAAGVFTRDLARAHTFAARLHAGNVYVNTYNDVSPFVPFGGFGQSGFGRENGTAALEHYTQCKSVFVNTDTYLSNPF